jgi:hypothetical protein
MKAETGSLFRKIIVSGALLAALVVLGMLVGRLLPVLSSFSDDFATYWRSARLTLGGENPYSPAALQALQEKELCSDCAMPTLFWYPPWVLTFLLPFGWLPYATGRLLWLLGSYGALTACGFWLWKVYSGAPQRRGWGLLLTLTFSPALFSLVEGAVAPLQLLGIAGFLYFIDQRRDGLAGALLLLLSFKPHLPYLFWLALLIWCIDRRRWNALLALTIAAMASTTLVAMINPRVVGDYWRWTLSSLTASTQACNSTTLSDFLCWLTGWHKGFFQLGLLIVGLAWLVIFWRARRADWQWRTEVPWLLLGSLLTVPYAWMHDATLLLAALIQAGILLLRRGRTRQVLFLTGVYLLVDGAALALLPRLRYVQVGYIWLPLAFLGLYVWAIQGAPAKMMGDQQNG